MSAYPQAPSLATTRPGTLKAAIGLAVVAGVAAIVTGILILAGGADLLAELVAKEVGESVDDVKALADSPLAAPYFEQAEATLNTRGYLIIVNGLALLVFGLLMRKAATWARVLVTLCALGTIGGAALAASEATTVIIAVAVVAIVGAVAALVTTWLPANSRFAKSAA